MHATRALFAVTLFCLCHSSLKAAIPMPASLNEGNEDLMLLIYDPADGGLRLEAGNKQLTALEIESAGHYFVGASPPLEGVFDRFTPGKLFILRFPPNQFGDYDFGTPLAPGLSAAEISADLTVSGAVYPFGNLGPVGVGSVAEVGLVYVPEPSTMTLSGMALLALSSFRRRSLRGAA